MARGVPSAQRMPAETIRDARTDGRTQLRIEGPPDGAIEAARVLVIDDQPLNVRLLERVFRDAGIPHVRGVTDPARAAAEFASFRPDLVLLDLVMPGRDGLSVLAELAAMQPQERYLPVVVLTGDVNPHTRARALAAGAEDFLTKPYDRDEIVLRCRNLLETRFLHQALARLENEVRPSVTA